MNANQIIESLHNHKGQHIKVVWERDCQTTGASVRKRVTAYVRSGIDYAKLRPVKEAIEARERGEVQPIWKGFGEWAQFPFIIHHVKKLTEYVRLYPASFKNLHKPKTEWFVHGQPVPYRVAKVFLKSCEFPKDETPLCFTVKVDDIKEIN